MKMSFFVVSADDAAASREWNQEFGLEHNVVVAGVGILSQR